MTQAATESPSARNANSFARWSLRETLGVVTITALVCGLFLTAFRLRVAEAELARIRREVGYLMPTESDELAAVRVPTDQPLAYRVRVKVPAGSPKVRFAYSSVMPAGEMSPVWFGAVTRRPRRIGGHRTNHGRPPRQAVENFDNRQQ